MNEMRLFDQNGNRLYLTKEERQLFLDHAKTQRTEVRTFAETIAYTGCRISEALEICPSRIEIDTNQVLLRTLKKRKDDVFRAVPVPGELIDNLTIAFDLRKKQKGKKSNSSKRLWNWTRQHAYEIIKKLMIDAGIEKGKHRMPKGLRHSYGVNAVVSGVTLSMLQKWMGHSDIKTTAIYANAIGKEEAEIASRMWK